MVHEQIKRLAWILGEIGTKTIEQDTRESFKQRPGMGSSRTVLELEDSSRTQNRGLGLGL